MTHSSRYTVMEARESEYESLFGGRMFSGLPAEFASFRFEGRHAVKSEVPVMYLTLD